MKSMKMITSLLILTQVLGALALPAGASQMASGDDSPEISLLSGLIALQGENLPKEEISKQAQKIYTDYDQTAAAGNRQERLTQAVVDMNIMTASAAAEFQSQIQLAVRTEFQNNPHLDSIALQRIFSKSVQGAQFSLGECKWNLIGAGLFAAGWTGLIMTVTGVVNMNEPTVYVVGTGSMISLFLALAIGLYGPSC